MLNNAFRPNISYSEAMFASLPVIGPAVCLWNTMKIDHEQNRAVATLSRLEKKIEEGKGDRERLQKKLGATREKYIKTLGKGITYSKCGMVSSFLTIAAIVALIATAIFSIGGGAIPLIVGLAIHAGIYRHNISKFSEDLEEAAEQSAEEIELSRSQPISTVPHGSIEPTVAFLTQLFPAYNGNMLSTSTGVLGQATRW